MLGWKQEYADEIISVGDFVFMGGDLPAMILLEGFLRLIPGVVGKQESVQYDSFSGPFVDYPEYTQPVSLARYRGSGSCCVRVTMPKLLDGVTSKQ